MCIFGRKPNPGLIDLHKYEHDCMRWKRNGTSIMPPPTPPAGSFTEEECAIMRDNQRQAMEIYEGYKRTNCYIGSTWRM